MSTPIVAVVGAGVTGAHVATRLAQHGRRLAILDEDVQAAANLARRVSGVVLGDAEELALTDVVALCHSTPHRDVAIGLVHEGVPVVSTGDDLEDVRSMLSLDALAADRGAAMVVGAGMAPGLSGLLAVMAAAHVDSPEEVHVAVHGTAGPACARQHHDALGDRAEAWIDGEWIEHPGGSGRELCWFPEPIGARDCYRAALADPPLLRAVFPEASRISARVSATRRDRLTARLPMLVPPHPAGGIGAVRAEVRGAAADGSRVTSIAGASGAVGRLAGAVCAACVLRLLDGGVAPGVHQPSSAALDPHAMLRLVVDLGVTLQEFTGVPGRLS